MADLFNQQISATYSGLLKTSSSGVLSASLSQISDGRGNTSPLYLSTDSIQFYGAYSFPNADGSANQVLKTDGAGVLTWEDDANTGTVTSVALSVPTGLTVTGSPITTSGTITIGGTLGVANGGTGATTLTGILLGNGTSAISAVTDGTVGQVLSTDGSGTYSFIDAGTGDVTVDGASVGNRVAVWNNTTGELRGTSAIATENSNIYLAQPSTNGTDKFNYIIGGAFAINENDFGTQNTGFGHAVLNGADLTGGNNSSFGMQSQTALTTGSHNTSIGSFAMYDNRSGDYNVGLGAKTMFNQRISNNNVSIGYDSMDGVTASQTAASNNNVAIGYESLHIIEGGDNNTVLGYQSGSAITTGSNNVIIGSNTGSTIATSSNNIIISDGGGNIRQSFDINGAATFSENVIINTENSGIIVDLASRHGLMKYANYGAGLVGKDTGTDGNISTWLGRFNGTITSPTAVYQDLVISNSGKVGIGTGSTAPSEKLDVYGNIKIGTTANSNFLNRSDSHWIQYNGGATTNDTYMRVYGVSHASAAKTIGFYTNNIPRLTISSTGNATFSGALSGTSINATSFNAGTGVFNFSSGDALLDYSSGAVRLRTYKTAVGYITPLTIDSQTGAATFSSSVTAASSITINGSSNGTIYFQDVPNNASMFYIQSAAYIGTAPYNDNRIIASNSSNITLEAGGSVRLKIESGGTVLPGADNAQNLGASGTRWSLIYSANGVSTSDETLKENIIECDLGIDFVMTLKPKSYNFKDLSETHQDFNKKHYGLIAQDLKDGLLKDSVDGNKDGEYGLMYNDLIAPMIKAIQEQQTIIEDLKARIEKLEG